MGVTVIKLTGSQFCRVWIMKLHKNESQRTFSYFGAELVNFDLGEMMDTFVDSCGSEVAINVAKNLCLCFMII